ncbi:MAG: permease [Desulfuromonadaceae bacterium]
MKISETCQVHGKTSRLANKTLLYMTLASLALVIWHVWVYGPSGKIGQSDDTIKSFPMLVGIELWDLLVNKKGVLAELWDVFPYFVAGILLAGYLRTSKAAVKLQVTLRRYGVLSVFVASFVGIITPLCACGTLTTAISLLFAGIPLAPVMALLVTSPLLSPSTYLITLNDLGSEWTVIRTIAALAMGIFAGLTTHLLRKRGILPEDLFIEGAITRGDFHDEDYPDERLRCNCKEKFGNRVAVRTGNKFLIFLAKSAEMVPLVGKYVLIGVVIGMIIERYMPYQWIYQFFGQRNPLNIVWITLGSVPLFLHQLSASSILFHIKSSLPGTLDGGAGLAFMIGGPVTAVPTMILFWTVFKKRVFFLYMFVCIVGTLLISYAFQFFVFIPGVDTGNHLLRGVGSISGGKSPVIQKQHQNVRIVMDPDGKSIIATYVNNVENTGGVVFDADRERFFNESADKNDNDKYIANVAEWLEQSGNSSTQKNILIYDFSERDGSIAASLSNNLFNALKQKGFAVRFTNRMEQPKISGQLLAESGQLWLFFGESGSQNQLSQVEINAISEYSDSGKSMLVVPGKSQVDSDGLLAVNRLTSRYGVVFSGIVENSKKIPVSVASQALNRASEILGRVLKLVNKA